MRERLYALEQISRGCSEVEAIGAIWESIIDGDQYAYFEVKYSDAGIQKVLDDSKFFILTKET